MNDLIKVTYDNDRITVSARELHEFLEIKTEFRKWYPRMCEYGFEENIDFARVTQKCPTLGGVQEMTDYQLTMDMAKEISMIQRNEKGKRARKYFIECEKKSKTINNLTTDPLEVLKLIVKANENTKVEMTALRTDVEKKFDDMPLFNIECHELQKEVKRKGTESLGGYHSPAYNDNSLRQRIYEDINLQIKREFGVSSYKAIKREHYNASLEIINNYVPPIVLKNEIQMINNQQVLDLNEKGD